MSIDIRAYLVIIIIISSFIGKHNNLQVTTNHIPIPNYNKTGKKWDHRKQHKEIRVNT